MLVHVSVYCMVPRTQTGVLCEITGQMLYHPAVIAAGPPRGGVLSVTPVIVQPLVQEQKPHHQMLYSVMEVLSFL